MKKIRNVVLAALFAYLTLPSATLVMARTYTTSFPLLENPISEGGNWINGQTTGVDWSDVSTTPGLATGLEVGTGAYDDSTALLTGTWGSNQTAAATVYTTNPQTGNIYEELEIRLRSSLSPHNCTGYEVLFSLRNDASAYVQIVRWNGAVGDFTFLATTSGDSFILHSGDTVQATVSGSTITAYINETAVLQGTDATYSSGSPGIGFFLSGATGLNSDYGFTSFTASDEIAPPGITAQPQPQSVPVTSNAVFSVAATGANPLFYRWWFNDTNAIPGATNCQLVVTDVTDLDGGVYKVSVSNSVGTVESDNASLIVDHPPVPASPTLQRYPGADVRILDAFLLGTDPDGDPLSLASVGPFSDQGGTVSLDQNWVVYTPPAGLTNNDSFPYSVSDNRGATADGTATIVTIADRGPSLSASYDPARNSIVLVGSGIPNRNYTIEFTDDLAHPSWQALGSAMSDSNGTFTYSDAPLCPTGVRYYRVLVS